MKKLLPIIILAIVVSACDIYVTEPRFNRRDALIGHYEVEEYSETYEEYLHYSLQITRGNYSDEIWLCNFYAADINVLAYVRGDHITIPHQIVDGYEIEGTGNIYDHDLHLSYSVDDQYDHHSPTDFCEAEVWFE